MSDEDAYRSWYCFLLRTIKIMIDPEPALDPAKIDFLAVSELLMPKRHLPFAAPKSKDELLKNYESVTKRGVAILQRREVDWSPVDVIDDFGFCLLHIVFDQGVNRIRITVHNEHPMVPPTAIEMPYNAWKLNILKLQLAEHLKRAREHHAEVLSNTWDKEHPTNV